MKRLRQMVSRRRSSRVFSRSFSARSWLARSSRATSSGVQAPFGLAVEVCAMVRVQAGRQSEFLRQRAAIRESSQVSIVTSVPIGVYL